MTNESDKTVTRQVEDVSAPQGPRIVKITEIAEDGAVTVGTYVTGSRDLAIISAGGNPDDPKWKDS